ncbi:ABC-type Fe3+-hydroxamate transport system, periplasmic component [Leptospira ryugenii]|uniref:ABC-type Fe3+-hydroxamate transport system, periplasmic component n=1 Tax=Leptospira ryugenii TaxID=1917863 RepID=A0A2P2E2D9_9LEPT|nr:ABC-type Fe3+-hydroxamate transport system, periplasmic component [Leptospira ryugenii]
MNGAFTEILFSLGLGPKVVAVDTSSTFPETTAKIQRIGYMRTLSAEGILSLEPDLVLATDAAGPPSTIAQIKATTVQMGIWTENFQMEEAERKIRYVARWTQTEKQAEALLKELQKNLSSFQRPVLSRPIKVLFLYARGPNQLYVSGKDTAADAMISLSGAKNAVDGFSDYKILSTEALVSANPDIILLGSHTASLFGNLDSLWDISGIKLTRAGKEKNYIIMDDLMLLGFGPRLPTALKVLAEKWKSLD